LSGIETVPETPWRTARQISESEVVPSAPPGTSPSTGPGCALTVACSGGLTELWALAWPAENSAKAKTSKAMVAAIIIGAALKARLLATIIP
jgi:hypothetical protein